MTLDADQSKLNLNDRALSGTASSNDPEADIFNKAREEVCSNLWLVHADAECQKTQQERSSIDTRYSPLLKVISILGCLRLRKKSFMSK